MKMSDALEKAIDVKTHGPYNWQERFIKFCSVSRRKIVRSAFLIFSIYLLIFYTPLIWFAAEPLRISQIPESADAIVVLAGGVGESGRSSQGYEERVEYAVNLYKQGYGEYLIFSSGYTYVFQESRVMKALAVSLGVPQDAIILEDKARNTYENVKFVKAILTDKNCGKILLVSSPYHMRRVSLVADELISDIDIVYTPIIQSRFYSRNMKSGIKKTWKQINLRQIKGLLHEYLGIVYYWWKGYI